MLVDDRPVYVQLAEGLAEAVLAGTYAEETPVPSATDLAVFHQMNPATASKGVNRLVEQGILYKRRGVGMFVAPGAREKLREERRRQFAKQYLDPLLHEAQMIGIDEAGLTRLIAERRALLPTAEQAGTGPHVPPSASRPESSHEEPTAPAHVREPR